jgi:hypothetical protein
MVTWLIQIPPLRFILDSSHTITSVKVIYET